MGNNPIPITDEYTYLGIKLTPNTKFNNACQQLSEKAIHALYKIRKQIDFHNLPPKLACRIFDGVISPILLYNSEIWGAYADNDFTKWDKCNNGSRGELGKLPLIIQIIKKILNYVTNLYKLPNSTLVKQAFLSSKELYLNGKESFYSNTVNLLHKHFPTLEKQSI